MKKRYLIAPALISFSNIVLGGGINDRTAIEYIRVDQDGRGVIQFIHDTVNPAACGSSWFPRAMAFDLNSNGGRALLDAALTAKANGRYVQAQGSGLCNLYGGYVEDINILVVF